MRTCTYKHIIRNNIITHVCCVQYTVLDSTSCGHTGTCSNKYGVLRRKVASSPGSPPHERTLILDLCTRRNTYNYKAGERLAMPGLNTRMGVFTSP